MRKLYIIIIICGLQYCTKQEPAISAKEIVKKGPVVIELNERYKLTINKNFLFDKESTPELINGVDKKTRAAFRKNSQALQSILKYNIVDTLNSKSFINVTINKTGIQENISNENTGLNEYQKAIIPVLEKQIKENTEMLGNDYKMQIIKKLQPLTINGINTFYIEFTQETNMLNEKFLSNSSLVHIFDGNEVISIGCSYTPFNNDKWQKIKDEAIQSLEMHNSKNVKSP